MYGWQCIEQYINEVWVTVSTQGGEGGPNSTGLPGILGGDGNLDDGDEITHTSVFVCSEACLSVTDCLSFLVVSLLEVKAPRQWKKDRNVDVYYICMHGHVIGFPPACHFRY